MYIKATIGESVHTYFNNSKIFKYPENLVAGQRYRIHWNGNLTDHSMDDLGIFVQMGINGAEFRDLNVYNPAGRTLIDVFHYSTDAFSFYESAQQLHVEVLNDKH